ncbi:hypothetical protein CWM36_00540 [Escherichia coli]|uniref:enoyl-CoA hydratase-related protein n=1 Tax=Escherichia coli TaxID=562 RepID=UPI000C2968D0|nr:enoyl-CoA hydratase-related protein [Escherichia coli]PJY52657.1 hypothetical protein CWM36_00540 [Escherichia coli]
MSYQYVNVVTINKVAVIEFNYGRKLNALSKVFIDDLMQALSDLNRPEIRCIILRALAVGILNHVVEVEELEDFTLQMAHHISEKAPLAIAVIKEELRVLGEAHTMNSDEFERIQGMRRAVYDSEDYQEGMNAFLEKRKPNFVGH